MVVESKNKRKKYLNGCRRYVWLALVFIGASLAAPAWPGPRAVVLAQITSVFPDKQPYGKSDLWQRISNQAGFKASTDQICRLAKTGLTLAAVLGVMWSLINLFRAAKESAGGRFRMAMILLFVSALLLTPATFFSLIGMSWLSTKSGAWACILGG